MKNRVLTGLAALTLLEISAEMAAAQNWSGSYVGGHIGYRWGHADHSAPNYSFPDGTFALLTSPARSESAAPSSVVGGVHAGYNFLFRPNLLAGLEVDLTAGSGDDSTAAVFVSSDGVTARRNSTVKLSWQSTIRARFGYVNGPWMVYATGGLAVARVEWSETITTTLPASFSVGTSDTRLGGTVGAGIEYFWSPAVLLRMQFLHEDFGSFAVPLAATASTGTTSVTVQKLVFGFSYKF